MEQYQVCTDSPAYYLEQIKISLKEGQSRDIKIIKLVYTSQKGVNEKLTKNRSQEKADPKV